MISLDHSRKARFVLQCLVNSDYLATFLIMELCQARWPSQIATESDVPPGWVSMVFDPHPEILPQETGRLIIASCELADA